MQIKNIFFRKKLFTAATLFIFFIKFIFAEHISFSANSMTGKIGDKSDRTELLGNAYVLTETMEIFADTIILSGEEFRYIEAAGSIKGKNLESKLEFSCEKLKYDRDTKISLLENNVTLKDIENEVDAKAQIIEYNQDTDIAIMQINIDLKQKDNTCNGAYAVYRKKEQLLELSGNAQIKQGDDQFRAQEIMLNLDTQEIHLDGKVKGSVIDEKESSSDKKTEDTAEKVTENKVNKETEKTSEDKNDNKNKKETTESKETPENNVKDKEKGLEKKESLQNTSEKKIPSDTKPKSNNQENSLEKNSSKTSADKTQEKSADKSKKKGKK